METEFTTFRTISDEISNSKDIIATFNMNQTSMDSMVWLSKRFKLSKKKLFDSIWNKYDESHFNIIKKIEIDPKSKRIKRSQRISKLSLDNLNKLAKKHKLKRDDIVILTFIFLHIVEKEELGKNRVKHKKVLGLVNDLWEYAEKTEKKSKSILDKDDTILHRLGNIIVVIMNLSNAIQEEIENGVIIDSEV